MCRSQLSGLRHERIQCVCKDNDESMLELLFTIHANRGAKITIFITFSSIIEIYFRLLIKDESPLKETIHQNKCHFPLINDINDLISRNNEELLS